jgi:hypothetical protein
MSRRPGPERFRGVVLFRALSRSLARSLALAATLLLLTGCAPGPVEVEPPPLADADAETCRNFVSSLPGELAGEERREVTGDDGLVAAWGDPAIVLRCGVDEPEDFTRTSTCIEANGTGWFVPDDVLQSDDEQADVTMTAVGFRPRVEVLLPGDYRPDGFLDATGTLGRLVSDQLELERRCR